VLGALGLREIAAPHLQRLTATTGHTSNLAIPDDTDVILIRQGPWTPRPVTTNLEFSLHAGFADTVLLQRDRARRCYAFLAQPDSTTWLTGSSSSPVAPEA